MGSYRTRSNVLLLLAWLALLAWLGWRLLEGPPEVAAVPDESLPPVEIEIPEPRPIRFEGLPSYGEIVERPLFYPDRRPEEAPEVVTAPPTAPTPEPEVELSLVGVMLTDNIRAALIRQDGTGAVARLQLGESVADWRLEQVLPRQVVLQRGSETRELMLVRNSTQRSKERGRGPRVRPETGNPAANTSEVTSGETLEEKRERLLQQRSDG